MRTSKKITLAVLILMFMFFVTTTINAATNYSASMSLSAEDKIIESGKTVTVSVNLTAINAGDGIDTIITTLNYDKNVFETVKESDITTQNGWDIDPYVESSGTMIIENNTKVNSASTVATIKLKFKENVAVEETTVTLKETTVSGGLEGAGGTGDIDVANASVTFTKEKPASEEPTPTTTTTPAKNIEVTKKDSTTAKNRIPQTGVSYDVVIALVVVSMVAIASYVAYAKTKKDIK